MRFRRNACGLTGYYKCCMTYRVETAEDKKEPRRNGTPDYPVIDPATADGRYFLLESEPDDELGDVLWFTLGRLAVDEGLALCEGWLACPVVFD